MSKIKIKYLDGKEYHFKYMNVFDYHWGEHLSLWLHKPGTTSVKHLKIPDVRSLEITDKGTVTIIMNPEHATCIDIISVERRVSNNRKTTPTPFPYKETGSLVQHLCDTIESLQKEIFTLKEGK